VKERAAHLAMYLGTTLRKLADQSDDLLNVLEEFLA
jgi:hypothetical protein